MNKKKLLIQLIILICILNNFDCKADSDPVFAFKYGTKIEKVDILGSSFLVNGVFVNNINRISFNTHNPNDDSLIISIRRLKEDYISNWIFIMGRSRNFNTTNQNIINSGLDSNIKVLNNNKISSAQSSDLKVSTKSNNEPNSKCLELDFCNYDCNSQFKRQLENFKLKKGDFFNVKIKNINPYLYNIKVTTQNDTFTTGTAPALFDAFMDVSNLGAIAANIISTATTQLKDDIAKTKMVDTSKLNEINKDMNLNYKAFSEKEYQKFPKLKNAKPNLANKIVKNSYIIDQQLIKDSIKSISKKIDKLYSQVNTCYTNSIHNIYNTKVDCFHKLNMKDCFISSSCCCLIDTMKINIVSIGKYKAELIEILNSQLADTTLKNQKLITQYQNLLDELISGKYSSIYLNKIYAKAYSNFLVAQNVDNISTYNSFPIQVQGDLLELKIDITPKSNSQTTEASKKKEDDKKEEEKKEEDKKEKKKEGKNNNNLSNQSPVTININTDTKPPTTTTAVTATTTAAKKEKEDTTKKESKLESIYSENELKVEMPLAVREYHLSYKYRTSNQFYGFGAGFFVDWLRDDLYTFQPNKTIGPDSFRLVKENLSDFTKYGIMASVNVGNYFHLKCPFFWQIFAGPGLSVEPKLQPRLLIGGGIGTGNSNKFSINGGVAFGQIKKISKSMRIGEQYDNENKEIKYINTNSAAWFLSVNYIFTLSGKSSEKEGKSKGEEKSK